MTQGLFNVISASVSDKGLSEKRPQNEDSYLDLGASGLYAVADGVGGAQAGDVASEMAVEILGEAFINLREDGDAEDRMRSAIDKANAAIYQMSRELPQLATMATTLVALHVNGNIATIGHVGDSRLYRLDETGVLLQETQDHSVVEEEVRAGRMTREQAASHPSRNVISRALGAESTVEIDMKTIMFSGGTSFLVCSDGITRHVTDEEIRDLLYMEDNPSEICRMLRERCFDRGAEDNLTAVVVKVATAERGINIDDPEVFELEIEEETVATARVGSNDLFSNQEVEPSPAVEPPSDGLLGADDSTDSDAEETKAADDAYDDFEDLEDTEEIVIPTKPAAMDSASQADLQESDEGVARSDTPKDVKAYRVDEPGRSGAFGRIVSGLVWLLVGVLIGGLSYFVYLSSTSGNPTDVAAVSNSAMVNFEQRRRQADADPGKYIAAYSAQPSTAGDHYLLGRAYLLQNNYGAAKTSLENALTKLDGADVNNRAILEYDILAGLTIAQDEAAQASYEGLVEEGQPEESDSAAEDAEKPKG